MDELGGGGGGKCVRAHYCAPCSDLHIVLQQSYSRQRLTQSNDMPHGSKLLIQLHTSTTDFSELSLWLVQKARLRQIQTVLCNA